MEYSEKKQFRIITSIQQLFIMPYQVIRVWADGRRVDYGNKFNKVGAKDAIYASVKGDERPFSMAETAYGKQLEGMQVGVHRKIYPAEDECDDYFVVRYIESNRRKAEAEDPEFKVGSEVCVHGLVNHPMYNGRFGRVKSISIEKETAVFTLEWSDPAEPGIKLTDKFLLPARTGPNGMEVVKRRKLGSDVVCEKIKLASDLFKDELISKEKYDAVMVKACTTLETVRFALDNGCITPELFLSLCKQMLAEGKISLFHCVALLWNLEESESDDPVRIDVFVHKHRDLFEDEKTMYMNLAAFFQSHYATDDEDEADLTRNSLHHYLISIFENISGDTEAKLRVFQFVRATVADSTHPLCDDAVLRFLDKLEGGEREVLIQCKKFLGEGLISEAQYGELADTMLAF